MISIVDETVVDLEKDDRDKDSIFQRVERRWLGFVEIPFATVYYSIKVSFNMKLITSAHVYK